MIEVKKSIKAMSSYSVPQEIDGVKLNQNESPKDIPSTIKDEIFRRLKSMEWNRYPSNQPDSLLKNIAAYTQYPELGIMLGNSSNELIQTVIYSLCDSGDKILTVIPGFSIYPRVSTVMNIETIGVPLNKDFSFNVTAILRQSKKAKLIILATPNNPTGTIIDLKDIKKLIEESPSLVVIDEAYYEFYGTSAQQLLEKFDNLILLRTFSKALRSASLRLGYLLGKPNLVKELKKARLPFSIGMFQQIAGEVIIQNFPCFRKTIDEIIEERERVYSQLLTIPFMIPVPSKANFILFDTGKVSAELIYRRLCQKGVLVRFFPGSDIENMLRVTIGRKAENDFFLKELKQIAEEYTDESSAV
jgi:histidinol-phosphate aminotransferase